MILDISCAVLVNIQNFCMLWNNILKILILSIYYKVIWELSIKENNHSHSWQCKTYYCWHEKIMVYLWTAKVNNVKYRKTVNIIIFNSWDILVYLLSTQNGNKHNGFLKYTIEEQFHIYFLITINYIF